MADDLQRRRFEFAIERINWIRRGGAKSQKALDKLPGLSVMIRTQGLLVAMALLREKEGKDIADAIESWLTRRAPNAALKGRGSERDFISSCTNASRVAYLSAQREAVELAQCLQLVREAIAPKEGV